MKKKPIFVQIMQTSSNTASLYTEFDNFTSAIITLQSSFCLGCFYFFFNSFPILSSLQDRYIKMMKSGKTTNLTNYSNTTKSPKITEYPNDTEYPNNTEYPNITKYPNSTQSPSLNLFDDSKKFYFVMVEPWIKGE